MKLFSKKKEAPDAEPQEKPDLIDYLNSLPEVEVPFKPFEEDPPVAVPEKTDAQRMADEIRQQSKAAELVPLAALKHAHEDWDALKPALESAEDCKDIVFVAGEQDLYYYSNRYMTDNYARIAMLVAEKDWPRTIAEMVRFNCKTYPAPTAYTYFTEHPYYMTRPQLDRALSQVFRNPDYADIVTVNAANGDPYLYSRRYFTDRYGKALADYAADETT